MDPVLYYVYAGPDLLLRIKKSQSLVRAKSFLALQ